MAKLTDLTVKELKAELVKLGMPEDDVDAFRTRAPLIATIKTMEATSVVKEKGEGEADDKVVRVKSIKETPTPSEERKVNKNWKNKAVKMKARLLAQEVISILIPLEPAEKKGVVVWAYTSNGDKMSVAVWNTLTLEEKMGTHQVHVAGAIESVQLNGYKYFIPKGVYTPVPEQIAKVISNSQQQTLDAGSEMKLDRIDPKTGRPFNEIL